MVEVKRCPNCRTPMQKASGCNQMLCRCGAIFCWGCGYAAKPWTGQHYACVDSKKAYEVSHIMFASDISSRHAMLDDISANAPDGHQAIEPVILVVEDLRAMRVPP